MATKKSDSAIPRRRGPRPGIRTKANGERLTEGRRLGLHLLLRDHERLTARADTQGVSVAALARDLILAGLG